MKNVLVLGNGYDLAHGLKTSYSDFLEFIKERVYKMDSVPKEVTEEFGILCSKNTFINYLIDYKETLNTWVDFENELKNITYKVKQFFDNPMIVSNKRSIINEREISPYVLLILEKLKFVSPRDDQHSRKWIQSVYFDLNYGVQWENIKVYLRHELDGLKKALVLYLKYYMPVLSDKESYRIKQLNDINPSYICTFNYTKTYERYGVSKNDFIGIAGIERKVLHIHGDLDSENIVLGYDDEDPADLALIQFKKYFQRIQYRLHRIAPVIDDSIAHVYGMSLDKTDQDIIIEIYKRANTVVIYYRVKEDGSTSDYEQKVINMIAILGKEEFLKAIENEKIVFEQIINDKL